MFKPALKATKSNLYGRLLIFVLLMIVSIILTSESKYLFGVGNHSYRIGGLIYSIFMASFIFYTVPMLVKLGYARRITNTVKAFAVMSVAAALYVSNPFLEVTSEAGRPYIVRSSHSTISNSTLRFRRLVSSVSLLAIGNFPPKPTPVIRFLLMPPFRRYSVTASTRF